MGRGGLSSRRRKGSHLVSQSNAKRLDFGEEPAAAASSSSSSSAAPPPAPTAEQVETISKKAVSSFCENTTVCSICIMPGAEYVLPCSHNACINCIGGEHYTLEDGVKYEGKATLPSGSIKCGRCSMVAFGSFHMSSSLRELVDHFARPCSNHHVVLHDENGIPHVETGCPHKIPDMLREQHDELCPYRPVTCTAKESCNLTTFAKDGHEHVCPAYYCSDPACEGDCALNKERKRILSKSQAELDDAELAIRGLERENDHLRDSIDALNVVVGSSLPPQSFSYTTPPGHHPAGAEPLSPPGSPTLGQGISPPGSPLPTLADSDSDSE